MRNLKDDVFYVKYPAKEKAAAFMPEDSTPFKNAIVGVTYPIPDYFIERGKTHVNDFEFVVDGEGEIFLDGRWNKVGAGDMFILCEQEPHRYRSIPESPWHKIWINYTAGYIGAFIRAYGVKSGIYRIPDIRTHFEHALELSKSADTPADICHELAKCVHNIIAMVSIKSVRERDTDHHRIREALGASVYKKVDLDSIAVELHMSKSNLIRIFKKNCGITPYDYLITLKLETAKLLLSNTGMTVKQIADKLCITDEHYFSTLFLKRVGMRPRDYRKSQNQTGAADITAAPE